MLLQPKGTAAYRKSRLSYDPIMSDPRIIERERVVEGKVFGVDRVVLRERDGSTRERHVVVHGGSVVVLPVLDDGRVVLIHNNRFAIGRKLWELCAGTLEKGEAPALAAARELVEETGYEASSIEPLCGFYTCPGFCTEFLHCFVATGLKHVGQSLDETEEIEVRPWDAADAVRMIHEGEIVDAKTIAALLYWRSVVGR